MRHWMVHPIILCRKHLIAENVEAHMFISSIKKGISMSGYLRNNLLEPLSLVSRHDTIAIEMLRRGYNHNSPVIDFEITDYITDPAILNVKVDVISAFKDLITRCTECRRRFLYFVRHNSFEISDDIIELFKVQDWLISNLWRYRIYDMDTPNFKRLELKSDHQLDMFDEIVLTSLNNYDKIFINHEYYFDCTNVSGGLLNPKDGKWEILTPDNLDLLCSKLL